MKGSLKIVGIALASALSTASVAQQASPPGQAPPEAQAGAAGAAPGQLAAGAAAVGGPAGPAVGGPGGPGTITATALTYQSYPIAAGVAAGNLEGAACAAPYKMISGACHPSYNDHVAIINQFPNIAGNTWRCGFKNNTTAAVTVYIYTLCGQ
jgi:hypothetical protein